MYQVSTLHFLLVTFDIKRLLCMSRQWISLEFISNFTIMHMRWSRFACIKLLLRYHHRLEFKVWNNMNNSTYHGRNMICSWLAERQLINHSFKSMILSKIRFKRRHWTNECIINQTIIEQLFFYACELSTTINTKQRAASNVSYPAMVHLNIIYIDTNMENVKIDNVQLI